MIKKESLAELEALVKEKPGNTCLQFSGGKMFAVLNGDTSCLTGRTQKSGEVDINGKKFTVYVGGSVKK